MSTSINISLFFPVNFFCSFSQKFFFTPEFELMNVSFTILFFVKTHKRYYGKSYPGQGKYEKKTVGGNTIHSDNDIQLITHPKGWEIFVCAWNKETEKELGRQSKSERQEACASRNCRKHSLSLPTNQLNSKAINFRAVFIS